MEEPCLLGISENVPINYLAKYSYKNVMEEQLSHIKAEIVTCIGTIVQITSTHLNDMTIQLPRRSDISAIEITPHIRTKITDFIRNHFPDRPFSDQFSLEFYKLNGVYETSDGFQNNAETISSHPDMLIKRNNLVMLFNEIIRYQQTQYFYEQLDNYNPYPCVVGHFNGCSRIVGEMFLPKGCLYQADELPTPGDAFISQANKAEYIKSTYAVQKSSEIARFPNYHTPPAKSKQFFLDRLNKATISQAEKGKSALEKVRQNYKAIRRSIFQYFYTEDDRAATLRFEIEYSNKVNNIALPTFLYFKEIPKEIPYMLIWGDEQRNGSINVG